MRRAAFSLTFAVCIMWAIGGCQKATNQTDDLQLLSLKSKCREDGEKVRSEWKKTYWQDVFSDDAEYAYNPSLKTCLWFGEYHGPSMDKEPATGKLIAVQANVKFILDVYTNKTLIEYTEHNGQQIGDVSEAHFNQRKAELFKSQ